MQTSDQSPEEQESSALQPFYEFPADNKSSYPPEPAANGGKQEVAIPSASIPSEAGTVVEAQKPVPPSDEAIRQGLVYPPPPTFYLNEEYSQSPAQPLPPARSKTEQDIRPRPGAAPNPQFSREAGQIPGTPFSPGPRQDRPGMQPPPGYVPGRPPVFYVPSPPVKKSKKWLWILISVISVIMLLSCAACGWAGYTLFGRPLQQTFSAATTGTDLVNNYYGAIQNKNYIQAYSYLSPQDTIRGLTQEQFTQQAQSQDQQNGVVLTYTPGQPSIDNNSLLSSNNITHFTIPVRVGRQGNKQYNVLLTISEVNNAWKITDYDRI